MASGPGRARTLLEDHGNIQLSSNLDEPVIPPALFLPALRVGNGRSK